MNLLGAEGNFKNGIKSRKSLYNAIHDASVPRAISNLRMTMNIVMLILIGLAVTEFVIVTS